MPDEVVAESAVLDEKPQPKDLAAALEELEVERAVNEALSGTIDKERADHAETQVRADQLATAAADLAPRVSQVTAELSNVNVLLGEELVETEKLDRLLVRLVRSLFARTGQATVLPTGVDEWWSKRAQELEADEAVLRRSGLAKLTDGEKAALGVG